MDVCNILSDSASKDPGAYWRKLKQRLKAEGSEVVTNCHGLKLQASDGKYYKTDVLDTKGVLRLVQSIPSPKAEPFKMWLSFVSNRSYNSSAFRSPHPLSALRISSRLLCRNHCFHCQNSLEELKMRNNYFISGLYKDADDNSA